MVQSTCDVELDKQDGEDGKTWRSVQRLGIRRPVEVATRGSVGTADNAHLPPRGLLLILGSIARAARSCAHAGVRACTFSKTGAIEGAEHAVVGRTLPDRGEHCALLPPLLPPRETHASSYTLDTNTARAGGAPVQSWTTNA